jgi:chemotaxis protein methyltransferase CheR
MPTPGVQHVEMRLLLEGVLRIYGHDFRDYAEASLHRRLHKWLAESRFATFSEAQGAVLRDPAVFHGLLQGLTVHVTEMFRDPAAFRVLREQVVPHLRTYPFLKVWVAGCATGEEAYSMAILLDEEGFKDRYRIYATDVDPGALEQAKAGIYPLKELQRFTQNYQKAGGRTAFSDYYSARFDRAMLEPHLRDRMVFATHNLVGDAPFGEMHLVLCRNVLIYFKPVLKMRVLALLDASILPGGFLGLGLKEGLETTEWQRSYAEVAAHARLYRKRYA